MKLTQTIDEIPADSKLIMENENASLLHFRTSIQKERQDIVCENFSLQEIQGKSIDDDLCIVIDTSAKDWLYRMSLYYNSGHTSFLLPVDELLTPEFKTTTLDFTDNPNLLIYGTGAAGKTTRKAIEFYKNAQVVGFVDSFKSGTLDGLAIYQVSQLPNVKINFDYIVIASVYHIEILEELYKINLQHKSMVVDDSVYLFDSKNNTTIFDYEKDTHLEIMTTSFCNLDCKYCSHAGFRSKFPRRHLSMKDLKRFIECTVESNYSFSGITLCGGEPLLWPYLEEGVKLIKQNLDTHVCIVTNGMLFSEKHLELFDYIDSFRLSVYPGLEYNFKPLLKAANRYPGKFHHTWCKNMLDHLPLKAYPNTLPANCNCYYPVLIYDKVYICTHYFSGSMALKTDPFENTECYSDLVPYYLDHFKNVDKFSQQICSGCISNRKVNMQTDNVRFKHNGGNWMNKPW